MTVASATPLMPMLVEEKSTMVNTMFTYEILPGELEQVDVVTLYKKGTVGDPSNYRPIALLSVIKKNKNKNMRRRSKNDWLQE